MKFQRDTDGGTLWIYNVYGTQVGNIDKPVQADVYFLSATRAMLMQHELEEILEKLKELNKA